ncbi:uncharacterized protein F5891DRAFT_1129283 [Suillus fuscotomentosus]|uniref:Uncharacterized protein n=1 Tax=Suillus fuscotomentosus TaxID=1912939 RepID=A0AAD4E3A5_9AGAM|nr:uncharacterized protein F5891DRAFT_1129283 [Suillus fuscotomentosus]KAG1898822.1 hypothetical protein F5891DRAFT_1129283 [Suillus fuscotomentosus]
MEHHPSSNIEAEVYAFNDFKCHPAVPLEPPSNTEPWHPFHSRLEFEVELALEAGLNNEQTDRLIKICHHCTVGKENFTFKNHKDIHVKWEAASFRITKFTKEVISVPYDGKTWNFDLHYRDLWGLASDLLGDPHIFPHFTFDAQHLSKFDGETFVRFVDEPYTAQDFWDVQSQLLPGGKPLAFILYTDKTRLSSFGTVKGYPVVAHLANLPTGIRNGQGTSSGYMIGWLPIVKEDKDYAGKPSWVNFKNAVWHESFRRITSSLASKSRVGQWFTCMDGVECWFFLIVLILSTDYEEQCVMSLTRGVMSLWPCPICLVPRDALSDTSKTYMRRTADDSRAAVTTARAKDTIKEPEEVLKVLGLRNIENALWAIQYSDVHRALSHDRCHFNHGGLWSHHYWVELQKYIARLGRAKVSQVDKAYQAFPHWQDLRHPNQVMNVSFADSAMHEDISKMIIYATHNILTEDKSPLGYLLLRCVRLYLEADIYAAFEVHTTATISAGRGAVQALMALMKQYIIKTEDDDESDKDWNFLKLHMLTHLFDDIEAKGASRNYNTKPNKQMYGPLKDWYQERTNFKDFAEQILRIDHWFHVADDIRRHLLDLDDHLMFTSQGQANDDDDKDEDEDAQRPASDFLPGLNIDGSLHVKLGSSQAPQTFALIEDTHQNDDTFTNFCVKLNSFLNDFLPACNIPLPDGKRIHLKSDVAVTAHQFLRVNFESLIDWRQHTDYLRCNPCFYNAPCFDCVFIQTCANVIIGCLLFLFDCPVGEDLFPLALVHPFDARTAQAEFFSVRSIIRGALLVHDASLDYLVVDTVDTDMFLRVKEMHLQAGHVVHI